MLETIMDNKNKGKSETMECLTCGLTLTEFEETGRLGCYDCYNAFSDYLNIILQKIHYCDSHKGKQLDYIAGEKHISQVENNLLHQLKLAVIEEEYEEATSIHQQLKELENKNDTHKDP